MSMIEDSLNGGEGNSVLDELKTAARTFTRIEDSSYDHHD
jgi:hypothetical protein